MGDEAQPNQGETAMTIKTNVKAGGLSTFNHNETLTVRSAVKAGGLSSYNHNEALAVRSNVKAGNGGWYTNHNESFRG